MVVLPCGACAKPCRAQKSAIATRLCSSASASSTTSGGRQSNRFSPASRAVPIVRPCAAAGIPLKRQSMRSSRIAATFPRSMLPGWATRLTSLRTVQRLLHYVPSACVASGAAGSQRAGCRQSGKDGRSVGSVDVLCLGEAMALFVPAEDGPVADGRRWSRTAGGAESNVACHLAGLGLRAAWVCAVGGDPFGRAVSDFMAGHGVDVSGGSVDPDRPTGVYFKTPGGVRYYRRGSAAASMGPDLVARLPLASVRLLHTSG